MGIDLRPYVVTHQLSDKWASHEMLHVERDDEMFSCIKKLKLNTLHILLYGYATTGYGTILRDDYHDDLTWVHANDLGQCLTKSCIAENRLVGYYLMTRGNTPVVLYWH